MSDHETFGQMVKRIRKGQGIGLREFCRVEGYHPSYICNIENGNCHPPAKDDSIQTLMIALCIPCKSDDWYKLIDLAFAENGRIPTDLKKSPKFMRTLPELFARMRRDLGQPKRETNDAM